MFRPRARVAECSVGRLLHHLAQGTGKLQPSATGNGAYLDLEHFATSTRIGESRCHANPVLEMGIVRRERARAEQCRQVALGYGERSLLGQFQHATGKLARDTGETTFQVTHAGLTSPPADDRRQYLVAQRHATGINSMSLELPRKQV